MFKVNNRNSRTRSEICSKLSIKEPERHHLHCYGVFIDNFEHISHLVLVFLLLTLNKQLPTEDKLQSCSLKLRKKNFSALDFLRILGINAFKERIVINHCHKKGKKRFPTKKV